jgi:hypothetical protein
MKTFISSLDEQFFRLHTRSCQLVQNTPNDKLYRQPREIVRAFPVNSCGEYILRSAGKVEQAFGGITTKLWDDPFEWTLPEALSTGELVLNYLSEVEATRRRGFALFKSDDELRREIPAPEKLKTIFSVLVETLALAENYQGRALAIFQIFSDKPSDFLRRRVRAARASTTSNRIRQSISARMWRSRAESQTASELH